MKDVAFLPCRHRKDIAMVSKLRKYIANPSLTSKSGWQSALVAHRNSGSAAAAKASWHLTTIICCCFGKANIIAVPRAYELG